MLYTEAGLAAGAQFTWVWIKDRDGVEIGAGVDPRRLVNEDTSIMLVYGARVVCIDLVCTPVEAIKVFAAVMG